MSLRVSIYVAAILCAFTACSPRPEGEAPAPSVPSNAVLVDFSGVKYFPSVAARQETISPSVGIVTGADFRFVTRTVTGQSLKTPVDASSYSFSDDVVSNRSVELLPGTYTLRYTSYFWDTKLLRPFADAATRAELGELRAALDAHCATMARGVPKELAQSIDRFCCTVDPSDASSIELLRNMLYLKVRNCSRDQVLDDVLPDTWEPCQYHPIKHAHLSSCMISEEFIVPAGHKCITIDIGKGIAPVLQRAHEYRALYGRALRETCSRLRVLTDPRLSFPGYRCDNPPYLVPSTYRLSDGSNLNVQAGQIYTLSFNTANGKWLVQNAPWPI